MCSIERWYQLCPVCHGSGVVSGGFYDHSGDCPYWTTDHAAEPCRCCGGEGIIFKKPEPYSKVGDNENLS